MRERPILFSAPMVRAILSGSKSQTRRVVKPQPERRNIEQIGNMLGFKKRQGDGFWLWPNARERILAECPYGAPGDQLLVRETHFAWGRWETRYSAKKSRDEWHFVDMTLECGHEYAYAADGHSFAPHQRTAGVSPCWWKRPAIFMPRAASRITLEVTRVRVERLQDISEVDAISEGVRQMRDGSECWVGREGPRGLVTPWPTAREAFRDIWQSINGPDSWGANPWVWVVEFRRIES